MLYSSSANYPGHQLPTSQLIAGLEDQRLLQLRQLVFHCLHAGISFDQFFRDYIAAEGGRIFWNPFWRYGERYSPAELYRLLRLLGFGVVPEAAVNVFWQLQEQQIKPLTL